MNKKPLYYFLELFQAEIYISYGVSKKIYQSQVEGVIKKEFFAEDCYSGQAVVFEIENRDVFWIWTDRKSPSILAHECVHTAFHICKTRNITPDDELIAYLVQHIMSKILL